MPSAENCTIKRLGADVEYLCVSPDSPAIGVYICRFSCGSLSDETALVVSFADRHRCGEVGVDCGTNLFEPDLIDFNFPLGENSHRLYPLEDASQTVHVAVPQIDFRIRVRLHYS